MSLVEKRNGAGDGFLFFFQGLLSGLWQMLRVDFLNMISLEANSVDHSRISLKHMYNSLRLYYSFFFQIVYDCMTNSKFYDTLD